MKATERTRDLIDLRQELQRFISEALNNEDRPQIVFYVEQLKKILHKQIDTGVGKQHEKFR